MTQLVGKLFEERLRSQGIELTPMQMEQFAIYYKELVAWNEKMNLTGITEQDQVYNKHFYDSLSLAFFLPIQEVKTMADIGAGAGFPSIPLKIAFPHLQVTIIDSLKKRITFLEHLARELTLTGATFIHGRAEEWGRKSGYRDQYDLVTARAVARLNVLNEFCLPFVRKGGWFAAMKGADPKEEVDEARFSMTQLKAKLDQVHRFELPVEQAERHIIILQKTEGTPAKYPRAAGTPLKKPLIAP
ncbi:16S rRNA (guanine(527)-N(7))-methyltransferase RsmG [Paenibacillus sp. J2TS4]|uniref:16S rRNA (guanine(527)-N(7))-methyltransferase RsmG n=1 Tax=Paenibacillus sp. J2TS4 TaxID=2807194 RepID=UPI001B08DEAE|nr:16S rRNA (guanine(527)-N(7))-methyltransferase RsmG [Paenibacillus sp. J2TS4]GIP36022.1 ribosomal RNA small subunit methyltransferase G [Paenibacillus sp. J2TS4]